MTHLDCPVQRPPLCAWRHNPAGALFSAGFSSFSLPSQRRREAERRHANGASEDYLGYARNYVTNTCMLAMQTFAHERTAPERLLPSLSWAVLSLIPRLQIGDNW